MRTTNAGIDYGLGQANVSKSGIRYGVIPHQDIGQAWYDGAEANYGDPTCPKCGNKANKARVSDYHCPNCKYHFDSDEAFGDEPRSFYVNSDGLKAEQSGDDCDIFVLESPFFTYAQFCSPCAPGACYLRNPLDEPSDNNRAYCFGHDWFEGGVAPYPVYSVETGKQVVSEKVCSTCPNCTGSGKDTLARLARIRQCAVSEINLAELHVNNLDATAGTFDCFGCDGSGKVSEMKQREIAS